MRLRDDGLTREEIDEEIVVLDLRASNYLELNGAGALLWKALEEGSDESPLARLLNASYELEPGAAQRDVDAFLQQLQHAKLIVEDR